MRRSVGTKIPGLLYWNISCDDVCVPHVLPTRNYIMMHLMSQPKNVWQATNTLHVGQGCITMANGLDYMSLLVQKGPLYRHWQFLPLHSPLDTCQMPLSALLTGINTVQRTHVGISYNRASRPGNGMYNCKSYKMVENNMATLHVKLYKAKWCWSTGTQDINYWDINYRYNKNNKNLQIINH